MDLASHFDLQIRRFDRRIAKLTAPLEEVAPPRRLQRSWDPRRPAASAEVIVAEIGVDMSRFPTSRQLASWAGLCPGNDESAGKRRSGRTTKGSPWLRTALVEAALGATRAPGYLRAKYRRVRARRGHHRAVIAVAHALLEVIHRLLSTGELYVDLGPEYFERRQAEQLVRRAVRQLERLGHRVILEEVTAAAPG